MKIIKQNDSAGGLIFKQNTDGKAMKQNYNFSDAIILSSSYYLDFPTLVGAIFNGFSCLIYHKSVAMASNFNGIMMAEFAGANVVQMRARPSVSVQLAVGAISNTPARVPGSVVCDYTNKATLYCDASNVRANNLLFVITTTNFFPATISKIWVNRYLRDTTNNVYDGCNPLVVSEIRVNNAKYTVDQYNYEYNNKLGNGPLNNEIAQSVVRCQIAEILDFGVIGQFVGVRDVTGKGNHARINGLPVGTLQQQVDFANANIFVKW